MASARIAILESDTWPGRRPMHFIVANYLLLHIEEPTLQRHSCLGTYVDIGSILGAGDFFRMRFASAPETLAEVFDILATSDESVLVARLAPTLMPSDVQRLKESGWREHEHATSIDGKLSGISLSPFAEEIVPTGHWPFWDARDANTRLDLGLIDEMPIVIPYGLREPQPFENVFSIERWKSARRRLSTTESPLC